MLQRLPLEPLYSLLSFWEEEEGRVRPSQGRTSWGPGGSCDGGQGPQRLLLHFSFPQLHSAELTVPGGGRGGVNGRDVCKAHLPPGKLDHSEML